MRGDTARLGQDLTAFDVFTLDTTQQDTDIVASLPLIQQLAEHFNSGHDRFGRGFHADDFDFFLNT